MDGSEISNTLDLPKSLAAFRKKDFKTVLQEELEENENDLPLEDCMINGGWPEPGTLEIQVRKVSHNKKYIHAEVQVWFDETSTSSCADITRTNRHTGTFDIKIDREDGSATIEMVDHESTDEEESDDMDIDDGQDTYFDDGQDREM